MEFGIFLNGFIPGPAAHIPELEHVALSREAEYAIFADKHNWKYAWFGPDIAWPTVIPTSALKPLS